MGTQASPRTPRIRAQDAADASARARAALDANDVSRHRARALRRLLAGLVRRALPRSARHRRAGRREAARLRRAHRAPPILRRAAEGGRDRPRRGGACRGGRALDAALPRRRARGSAHGDDRPAAPRAAPDAVARPRGARSRRGGVQAPARPAPLRGRLRQRPRRARAAARPRPRRRDPLREDRPDRRRSVQRARDRAGLQVGEERPLGGRDREGAAPADPALHARAPRPRGDGAARRRLSAARRRTQGARLAALGRGRDAAGLRQDRLPRRGRVLGAGREGEGDRARLRAADPTRRREARPEERRVPGLVRPLDRLPDPASMNDQQTAAVEASGEVFVSAGAGTGKTAVLVERFVRAVCDRGLDIESILVITYTRKAAAELRSRIRAALHERGRHDLARELDGAWISTIHGFCNRLLKAYPFAAGLDPRFRELDEPQAAVLRHEAFDAALAEFCAGEESERLQLLATYGAAGLRRMLTSVYETLRSAGHELVLELGEPAPLGEAMAELYEAARCLAEDAAATAAQRAAALGALDLGDERPDRLLDLSGLRAHGERAPTYEEARRRVEQAALDRVAAKDRALLQDLLYRFADAYAAAKRQESAVDFEDLQLAARDLLRDDERIREREQLRFR